MQAFLDLLEASKSVEDAMQNILKELDTRFQASKQITAEVSDTGHQHLLLKPLHIFLKAYLQDLCNQQSTEWRKIDRTHHVSVALIHAYICLFGRENISVVFMALASCHTDIRLLDREHISILQEKAGSSASGCIVALDAKNMRIYTVRSGGSAVAVGKLVHGLATQLTEAAFVHRPKNPS